MTDDCQFWLNWGVRALGTVATTLAVVVALFGDWIRARLGFLSPKLSIRLKNRKGEFAERQVENGERIGSRWYHIEVKNRRRWSPAKDVRLCLLRFEQPNAAGQYEITWTGDMPFLWRDGELRSLTPDLGSDIDCDLCSVTNMPDRQFLQLHPIIRKFQTPTLWDGPVKCALTFQARSLLVDSNLLRIEIAWDGQWAEDTEEMSRHLVINESASCEA
jgi:hypothetical protein